MIKKTLTFEDLDGNSRTEDFYFNLSKPELHKISVGGQGNFMRRVQEVMQTGDHPQILDLFTEIFQASVGKRSDDGVRFIKNQDVTDYFMQSDAFSVLYFELLTNTDALAQFIVGLVPRDMQGAVKEGTDKVMSGEVTTIDLPSGPVTIPQAERINQLPEPEIVKPKVLADYSDKELDQLSDDEFAALMHSSTKGKNVPYRLLQAAMRRLPQAE